MANSELSHVLDEKTRALVEHLADQISGLNDKLAAAERDVESARTALAAKEAELTVINDSWGKRLDKLREFYERKRTIYLDELNALRARISRLKDDNHALKAARIEGVRRKRGDEAAEKMAERIAEAIHGN